MDFVLFLSFYLISFILSIPIHELGHLIFGVITGYRFSSFRLFSLVWFKENGKITMNISKGVIIGQCLMTPPKDEEKFQFTWYNLGGGVFNLITALIMFIIAGNFINNDSLRDILTAGITANIVMGFMNLLPMSFGIPNDGMNVVTALRSKEAKHAAFLMLIVNDETANGKRFRDFDPQIFQITDTANYNNYFIAYIVMCEATRLYDMGEYEKSIEQYNCLNMNKLQQYYRNSVNLDLLYYYTVHKPDFEKAKKIYADKYMKNHFKLNLPSICRVLSAYEYFVNNDNEKGKLLLDKAKREIENYPNNGIKNMEKDYCLELEKLY